MAIRFEKSFTQQEPIPEEAIARAAEILRSGRLHRYNTAPGETAEASLLEEEYAAWQGARFCLAVTSGGQAMQIALRATGVKPGTKVLANAYTLAPVPGALHAAGAEVVLVEIDRNWHTDIADLCAKADATGATHLMLSHMRGHICDMDAIMQAVRDFDLTLIEDCAHTMGARWKGIRSGNFGHVACFSTQTYKHMNSGEGGFLTTDDPDIAARAVVTSGSYMLYGAHGAIPEEAVFRRQRLEAPNSSARIDNLRAALLRAQLPGLEDNVRRWNERYDVLSRGFAAIPGIRVPERAQHEAYVGSSFQFQVTGLAPERIPELVAGCAARGVEIKWFGADEPQGFTSRFDSWRYLGDVPDLPQTRAVLATTCDIRVPLTFAPEDCAVIVQIAGEELAALGT
ncbi:aminotransferase class I/II-fold pyridoxal phosphate-dependent enzyme [Paralimibaculum aggregatum]|uniref:Aminotransferase class I/II-fold pyridoxal phosphate-dependent enzyme n=1 Tax=Paralimibaculum aggregatum TaxID=3036245 RepID=A0ABQ6LSZ2_9RHOB|nr:aminotransferase class I/II-fold pyridoxal phosphate-dependent enzyme [Limibaculum sp. NKW23]GMG85176.1 aminotransferase class I/II-fold pyridoxal phosphate-dependent enzyme [Limibaculum sp. NKW23]